MSEHVDTSTTSVLTSKLSNLCLHSHSPYVVEKYVNELIPHAIKTAGQSGRSLHFVTSSLYNLSLFTYRVYIIVIGTTPLGVSNRAIPPLTLRFTFGLIFAGAGYILSTGDYENGCGITTCKRFNFGLVVPAFLTQKNTSVDRKLLFG